MTIKGKKKTIMERVRARHRQWQRPTYLARRHAQTKGKRLVVKTDYQLKASPSTKKQSQKDEGIRRRVSVFSVGWRMGTSVKMNTVYLNELILKEWKKKKNECWRYKNTRIELMKQTIFNIKRTWRKVLRIRRRINRDHKRLLSKFYNKYTPLCDEELRPNIEDSSNNWSKGVARTELSNFMFEQRVLENGWMRWI